MPFKERRKYARVWEAVPCRLSLGPSFLVTQTKNLSCGGVLCQLSQPIPAMTQLDILMELPVAPSDPPSRSIRCVGVVVRQEPQTEPEGSTSYLTAIYFSEIKQEDRRHIAEFVLKSMLSHDRRRS